MMPPLGLHTQMGKEEIKRFSDFHSERITSLMGHIIRTDNNDPLRQVALKDSTAERPDWGKKRAGKPRQNWIKEAKKVIWTNNLKKFEPHNENREQDEYILRAAKWRRF